MPDSDKPERASPSRALLSAALGALLWLSPPACAGGNQAEPPSASSGGSSGPATSSDAGTADAGAPFECDGGVSPNPSITSTIPGAMTQAGFMSLCAEQNGVFEIIPHCSGGSHCRGFAYDLDLQELMQHSCRGANTCAGYNCVVCDD
ncbi:MAG TPA: hypothetical protein VMB50_17160 [Myxococcales bacterium]|nr:hypothetical protein [Myxococcales bacterium]